MHHPRREAHRHRPDGTSCPAAGRTVPDDPLADLVLRASSLGEYAQHYVATGVDRLRLRASDWAAGALLQAAILLIGTVTLVCSALYFVQGLAGLLGEITARPWAGKMLAGALSIAAVGAAAWLRHRAARQRTSARLAEKYQRRRDMQKANYGSDVEQAAQNAAPRAA